MSNARLFNNAHFVWGESSSFAPNESDHFPVVPLAVETGLAPSPAASQGTGGASEDAASQVSTESAILQLAGGEVMSVF